MSKVKKILFSFFVVLCFITSVCATACKPYVNYGLSGGEERGEKFVAFFEEWITQRDVDSLLGWFATDTIQKEGEQKIRKEIQDLSSYIDGDLLFHNFDSNFNADIDRTNDYDIGYISDGFYLAMTTKTYYFSFRYCYAHKSMDYIGVTCILITCIEEDKLPEEYEECMNMWYKQMAYGNKIKQAVKIYCYQDVINYLNNGGEL